jgi:hypothetical protein
MKKSTSNIIVFGVIAIVVTMGIVSYLIQKNTNDVVTPRIINEFVNPYTEAIQNQNYELAYEKFTSDEYKENYSLDEFIQKHRYNYEKYGKLQNIQSVSGLFLAEKEMHGPWTFKGTMMYLAEKGSQRIIIEVIEQEDKFKLYKTYRSFVSIRTKKDEIF